MRFFLLVDNSSSKNHSFFSGLAITVLTALTTTPIATMRIPTAATARITVAIGAAAMQANVTAGKWWR